MLTDLFEDIFLAKPINIFWHICAINNWKDVVQDQRHYLEQSKLFPSIKKIYISFIGPSKNHLSFLLSNNKYQLISYTDDLSQYERPCLHALLDWSKQNDSYIFYMHTKGVQYPENKNVWHWRQLLERLLIDNYIICLSKLHTHDVIGINLIDCGENERILTEKHNKHFSGNFWWSKTSYIRSLPYIRPDIQSLSHRKYWLCERWICVAYPNARLYNLASTDLVHYYHHLPPKIEEVNINI